MFIIIFTFSSHGLVSYSFFFLSFFLSFFLYLFIYLFIQLNYLLIYYICLSLSRTGFIFFLSFFLSFLYLLCYSSSQKAIVHYLSGVMTGSNIQAKVFMYYSIPIINVYFLCEKLSIIIIINLNLNYIPYILFIKNFIDSLFLWQQSTTHLKDNNKG